MNIIDISLLKDGAVERVQDLALDIISSLEGTSTIEVITALQVAFGSIIQSCLKDGHFDESHAKRLIADAYEFLNKMVFEKI